MPQTSTLAVANKGFGWRQLFVLIAALLLSRLLFILMMPATYSTDLYSWLKVMEVLQNHGNPYRETGVLNWPPFWMQILFGIHQVAKYAQISATHLIQATLVGGEVLVLCIAHAFALKHFDKRRVFWALFFGLAINPVSIFLSCQHCNYDVFVGMFVLLATWMLVEWNARRNAEAWLAACFFIGLGILAKTVPIILTPLLLLGFRRLSWPVRLFGAALVAAPFAIGMSVLFTLERQGVMEHVIGYRSLAGWYGITGLLFRTGWPGAMDAYQKISPVLFIAVMAFTAFWCNRKEALNSKKILMLALLMMLFIPTFGPGYSPPYILWYLPLMVILYATADKTLRRFFIVAWLITVLTYIVEYALFNSHGAFLLELEPSLRMTTLSEQAGSRQGQTLIRLPMFACYVALFFMLIKRLRSEEATVVNKSTLAAQALP